MLKRAQVKVEVQVKIERSIETEPTGGAQGGVALAAAGGSGSTGGAQGGVALAAAGGLTSTSGFVCFLCQDSMPAADIGGGPDLSDPGHPNHNSWRSAEDEGCPYPRTEPGRVAAEDYGEPVSVELHAAQHIEHTTNARACLACRHLLYRRKDSAFGKARLGRVMSTVATAPWRTPCSGQRRKRHERTTRTKLMRYRPVGAGGGSSPTVLLVQTMG